MKTVFTSFSSFALSATFALGAVLLGVPNPASAAIYQSMSAGGACKPAYAASNKFIFNNLYAENIGTTDQYVVCIFVTDDISFNPPVPDHVAAHFTAGATGGTAVCVIQTGYYYGGAQLSANVAGNVTLTAGTTGFVGWDESLLVRFNSNDTVTMNCKVPGSWRMGLIHYWTTS